MPVYACRPSGAEVGGPGERQPTKGIKPGRAATGRVLEIAQPADRRRGPARRSEVLDPPVAQRSAETERRLVAYDQLIADADRLPVALLLGGPTERLRPHAASQRSAAPGDPSSHRSGAIPLSSSRQTSPSTLPTKAAGCRQRSMIAVSGHAHPLRDGAVGRGQRRTERSEGVADLRV